MIINLHRLFVLLFIGLALCGLVASCQNEPQPSSEPATSQERIENYANGKPSRKFKRVNGKIEGLMVDYYPDGQIKAERYFVNDLQVGKTTLYYPDGKIKEVQYFENGLKNGGDTVFYPSGQVEFCVTLKDDKKNGYLRKWSHTNELIYEAKFVMDTLVEVKGVPVKK